MSFNVEIWADSGIDSWSLIGFMRRSKELPDKARTLAALVTAGVLGAVRFVANRARPSKSMKSSSSQELLLTQTAARNAIAKLNRTRATMSQSLAMLNRMFDVAHDAKVLRVRANKDGESAVAKATAELALVLLDAEQNKDFVTRDIVTSLYKTASALWDNTRVLPSTRRIYEVACAISDTLAGHFSVKTPTPDWLIEASPHSIVNAWRVDSYVNKEYVRNYGMYLCIRESRGGGIASDATPPTLVRDMVFLYAKDQQVARTSQKQPNMSNGLYVAGNKTVPKPRTVYFLDVPHRHKLDQSSGTARWPVFHGLSLSNNMDIYLFGQTLGDVKGPITSRIAQQNSDSVRAVPGFLVGQIGREGQNSLSPAAWAILYRRYVPAALNTTKESKKRWSVDLQLSILKIIHIIEAMSAIERSTQSKLISELTMALLERIETAGIVKQFEAEAAVTTRKRFLELVAPKDRSFGPKANQQFSTAYPRDKKREAVIFPPQLGVSAGAIEGLTEEDVAMFFEA